MPHACSYAGQFTQACKCTSAATNQQVAQNERLGAAQLGCHVQDDAVAVGDELKELQHAKRVEVVLCPALREKDREVANTVAGCVKGLVEVARLSTVLRRIP